MRESFGDPPFTFESTLDGLIDPTTRLLDQGTGGGERLLAHAARFGEAVGIDIEPGMIDTAERNRRSAGVENVSFVPADNAATRFPDASFDLITNRHSVLAIEETARLLAYGGHFLIQHVGGDNAANLFELFAWRSNFPSEWSEPLIAIKPHLEGFGLEAIESHEYRIDWWIHDIESLIFWLHSVPTPSTFDIEEHWIGINRAIEVLGDDRGIRTVEHREMLVARRV